MIIIKILGIKLIDRVGDDTDFVEFDLRQVNFVDMNRPTDYSAKVPTYHTPSGSYLAVSTLRDIEVGYEKYGFKRYGKATVVNEKRIADKIIGKSGTTIIFHCGNRVIVTKK